MKSITQADQIKCTKNLKMFGDFWTLWIIEELSKDELRYCGLQRALQNVNPVTLTNRLQKLEKAGLVERKKDTIDKLSVTYSLTPLGKTTLPIIEAINKFKSKAK